MNLTRTAIQRPIFIFMLVVAAILLGTMSYMSMRKEDQPDVTFGTIVVSTADPGASPEDVNELITKKIEDAVSGVSGIRQVNSTSQEGISSVVLQLDIGVDQDAAVNDVRSKVDSAVDSLPKEALKPSILKFDTTQNAVLSLAVSSTTLSSKDLRDLIDNKISDRFAQINGVVSVGVSGGDQREIQVRLSKDKLLQYGLGIADVQQAIASGSTNQPAGHLVTGPQDITVRVKSQFETPDDVRNMIVSINDPNNFNGHSSKVKLSDIADVVDSHVERTDYARLNGKDTIALAIQKARTGNAVEIQQGADDLIKTLEAEYKPIGLKFETTFQQAKDITNQLNDLRFALSFGVFLVAAIVFVFLHNLRGTLIVALAIPTCIFCSFIGMELLGFTINGMTMLSLQLAIGVLVDDAIVVLENIYRHLRMGEDPRDAALNGRGEIGLAAIAITMADIVVWLPVGFMPGIVGQFFRPMALGFVCAVIASLFVSFTLTPLLAARWYRSGEDMEHPEGGFARWFEARFHALENHYRNGLEWALNHRWFVFLAGNSALFAVIQFIAGGSAAKQDQAIQFGMPLFFLAVLGGVITFNHNFLRTKPVRTRWLLRLGAGVAAFVIAPALLKGLPPPFQGPAFIPVWGILAILTVFAVCLVWNLATRVSKFRYLAAGAAFGLVFPIISMAGFGFGQWKGEAVFKGGFFPDQDNGQVAASIQLPPGASLEATDAVVRQVEAKFRTDPDMKYVVATIGQQAAGGFNSASNGSNYGGVTGTLFDKQALTDLLPWVHPTEKLRTRSANSVSASLTQKIGRIPGAQVSIGATGGFGAAIQLNFLSDDHETLLATAQKVRDGLASGAIPGVINPQLSVNEGSPEYQVIPRRDALADAGLTPAQLANAMGILYQGNNDTKLRHNGREYDVRVMMDYADRNNPAVMSEVPITFVQGNPVFVPSVANIVHAPGVNQITRQDRAEQITVSADLLPGYASGNVSGQIGKWLTDNHMVPSTVTYKPGGTQDFTNREGPYLVIAFLLGIALVYMLLASLYDNLLYPFIIQISQPQAIVGALLALIITNQTLSIIGAIGLIALVGLVGKNAILVVDYTNTLRSRGRSRHDALVEAGPTRLRPIMMTTMALVLGMLPVAFAIGHGAEFRQTIGITVIGGISLSTLLTLLVIPCSYTIFDDASIALSKSTAGFRGLFGRRHPAEREAPEAPQAPEEAGEPLVR